MSEPVFRKVLVADRGEIAVRVLRTLAEMGIGSVAVFSEQDRDSRYVTCADAAFLVPAGSDASHLDIDEVIAVAKATAADAIHPGHGLLSDHAGLARACSAAGITWIGSAPAVIEAADSVATTRAAMQAAGVPIVPGSSILAPGAGEADESDPAVLPDRHLDDPRRIEVQVLVDEHGTIVHLGERDCSIQLHGQNVVSESPSPGVDASTRALLRQVGSDAVRAVDLRGVGTIECLLEPATGEVFFHALDVRLPSAHAVTESVMSIDMVAEQIRIAAGQPLELRTSMSTRGHAIACRVASSGAERSGEATTTLTAWGADRDHARRKMLRLLHESDLLAGTAQAPFHRMLLKHPEYIVGGTCTAVCDDATSEPDRGSAGDPGIDALLALEASASISERVVVEVDGKRFDVQVFREHTRAGVPVRPRRRRPRGSISSQQFGAVVAPIPGNVMHVDVAEGDVVVLGQTLCVLEAMKMENEIAAPAAGIVTALAIAAGDLVSGGQELMRIEEDVR